MCVYINMCVYVCICLCVYIYVCLCMYIYVYVYIYMYVYQWRSQCDHGPPYEMLGPPTEILKCLGGIVV